MDTNKMQTGLASEIARNGMRLITSGKIRNHKLGNSARIHTGEAEKKERQIYRDFLPSRNCSMAYNLTGSDCL